MLAISSQYANSSRRHGDILTHISKCSRACVCVCVRLDNATSRKGLNAHHPHSQIKNTSSHRRVGLPGDIIASLAAKDDPESS